MNVQGLIFVLTGLADDLERKFFDDLVNEGVSAAELHGTGERDKALVAVAKSTPHEQLDELVAKFDPQLTEAYDKFLRVWQLKPLEGFRDAQAMLGHVNTVFNEAGIKT